VSAFFDYLRQIRLGLKHLVALKSDLAQVVLFFNIIFVEKVEESLIVIGEAFTLSIIFLEENRFLK
jgi:hypothetical protein